MMHCWRLGQLVTFRGSLDEAQLLHQPYVIKGPAQTGGSPPVIKPPQPIISPTDLHDGQHAKQQDVADLLRRYQRGRQRLHRVRYPHCLIMFALSSSRCCRLECQSRHQIRHEHPPALYAIICEYSAICLTASSQRVPSKVRRSK